MVIEKKEITLKTFAKIILLGLALMLLQSSSSSNLEQDDYISIGKITNEIRVGPFAGNPSMAYGVRNILEELLLDLDYDLSENSDTKINIRLVFFDVKNIGKSIGIYHNKVSLTQIIAIGELEIKGKVKKRTTQKGSSKEISTSTLVVASDGQFNQQTASNSLKKVLEAIIKDLLK
jgi:hypothetical protein